MAAASVACSLLIVVVAGMASQASVLLGMIGPLAMAVGSWMVLDRTHARTPERVSGVMIKLFGAKMLFFGAYVASVVLLVPIVRMAFVVSFMAHYILLHFMEGLYLRRLFSGDDNPGERLRVS